MRSSAVWGCTEGVPLPTAPQQWGSVLKKSHGPLLPSSVAVYIRSSTGSQAGGTWRLAEPVVAAHSAREGDGSPQWHRLTGWGDRESSPAGGCSSPCVCGDGSH